MMRYAVSFCGHIAPPFTQDIERCTRSEERMICLMFGFGKSSDIESVMCL